jgi:hypothetical protein
LQNSFVQVDDIDGATDEINAGRVISAIVLALAVCATSEGSKIALESIPVNDTGSVKQLFHHAVIS